MSRADHFEADCRCVCGSLVARLVEGGVELKCRRCKRTVVVSLIQDPKTEAIRTEPKASAVALRKAG